MTMKAKSEFVMHQGDCLDIMAGWPSNSVDLVFCSPPYEDARTYGIDYAVRGQDWVDWCVPRFLECVRVCKGLVCWVVEGRTKKFQWSATPALLMADLHRAGVRLRKPPVFHRHGIAGSGGPDWWRNDFEFIVCASKGRLPWADPIACGWPCKYPKGGAFSNRKKDGSRANPDRKKKGNNGRPKITNPGNVIRLSVGKGHMGDDLAHFTEAAFPEKLADRFIRSFCPPETGLVFDPFCGSGTTLATAIKAGRRAIGCDIRESQVCLTEQRIRNLCG